MIDALIPVWGAPKKLERCLEKLFVNTVTPFNLFIIDDCSPNPRYLRGIYKKYKQLNNVKVIKNGFNLGFSRTCNKGAKLGDSEYILLLNSDVYVNYMCIDKMQEVLNEKTDVGIVGAKLLFPAYFGPQYGGGNIQHAGVYFMGQEEHLYPEHPQWGMPYHKWGGLPGDNPETNVSKEVPCVTGALLMTRRSIWELLDGLDVGYTRGALEDVDYNLRVRELGYKIWYCSEAVAEHHQWGSGVENTHQNANANMIRLLKLWKEKIEEGGELHGV